MPLHEMLPVEVRIPAKAYWRKAGPFVAIIIACMGYAVYVARGTGQPAMTVVVLVLLGAFVVFAVAQYLRFQVRVDAEGLHVRTLFSHQRLLHDEVASVVWIPYLGSSVGGTPDHLALAVESRKSDARPLRIQQTFVPTEELARITAALGVPEKRLDGVHNMFTIGVACPEYATFSERHWKPLTVIGTIGLVAFMGGVVTIASFLDGTL